ncbi:MAG: pilus assembly protein TadG-related protein [Acidimicrobiia bacterium]
MLILFGVLMTVLLGMAAMLVDFGLQRASTREAQSIADMAALGGGRNLSNGGPAAACRDAINYVNANARDLSPKITASGFCAQSGNDVAATNCSIPGAATQAKPSATVGRYTVTVVYPVLAADITDTHYSGAGVNDGTNACQRMGVTVSVRNPTTFGRIFGKSELETSRLAVVKAVNGGVKAVPALWLLDPFGCPALSVSGAGTSVTVGRTSPLVPGLITVDSNGSDCGGTQTTLDVPSGTLTAVPTSGPTLGAISLFAPGAASCSGSSCDPSDVGGALARVNPHPVQASERATRSPVDWQFNCKSTYPAYHTIAIDGCPNGTPAYIDNLASAVGNSTGVAPNASFLPWSPTYSCNPSGSITVAGNWWVNCPSNFSIGTGTNVTFSGGNVVFDGNIKMTGGSLSLNTANLASALPSGCRPPTVTTLSLCISSSSTNAAFLYMRNGEMNITGGALNLQHVVVYQKAGAVKDTGGAAPTWTPPAEGPFTGLSLWSEKSDPFTINGGGGLQLAGVFFTPEASPFKVTGGGGVSQQSAQFISYRLDLSGGGSLYMAPDPTTAVPVPATSGVLIR